jgi:hypothetical protein
VSRLAAAIVATIGLIGTTWAASAEAAPNPPGYWQLGGDGGVFSFGGARFFGAAASDRMRCPAVTTDRDEPDGTCFAMASTPTGDGYWILNGDTGMIFAYGAAQLYGDPATTYAGAPREFLPTGRAIVATPDGHGYWVLESGASGLAQVLSFGDAADHGDTLRQHAAHVGVPVAMAATPDGGGYWIADSDGGVFAFGNAHFFGSMGGVKLQAPIVAMAATSDGRGYYLAAADGGVFTFGDAAFAGSAATLALRAPVVGIAVNRNGAGYWLAARDGGIFSFGGAPFLGSLADHPLARPVFAIAATPGVG